MSDNARPMLHQSIGWKLQAGLQGCSDAPVIMTPGIFTEAHVSSKDYVLSVAAIIAEHEILKTAVRCGLAPVI